MSNIFGRERFSRISYIRTLIPLALDRHNFCDFVACAFLSHAEERKSSHKDYIGKIFRQCGFSDERSNFSGW